MKNWQSLTISIMAHAALLSIPLTAAMQLQYRQQTVRFIVIDGGTTAGGGDHAVVRHAPVRGVAVRKTASTAEATVSHTQPSRPSIRPQRSTLPEPRAEMKRPEKLQPRSAKTPVPSRVSRRKVVRPRVSRKAPASVAPSHVQTKVAVKTKPSRTVAMTPTAPAAGSNVHTGGAAPATTSAATGGGPIEARWGAANGPRFLHRVMPQYPRLARRLGREGTVLLRVTIDKHGRPVEVKIVKGAGYGFDDQARTAVRSSLFVPAREAGRAVCCKVLLPVRFVLRSSP